MRLKISRNCQTMEPMHYNVQHNMNYVQWSQSESCDVIFLKKFNGTGGAAMDYYAIGQRIRKVRKAHGLSQEQLAEQVGISTTHMSHIETGNTKLSLPVLVDIACILNVHTDDLLFETGPSHMQATSQGLLDILNSCTYQQAQVLIELLKTAKTAMDRYIL